MCRYWENRRYGADANLRSILNLLIMLLVNKRDWTIVASVPGASGGRLEVVDQQTAFQPPAVAQLGSDEVTLGGLAVAVVTLP